MRIVKANKLHVCKKCHKDIWPNGYYYPQRRNKAICFDCGSKKHDGGFISWLLNKLK